MNAGDIYTSSRCGDFEVLEYYDSKNIKIKFLRTGCCRLATSGNIRRGSVSDPFAKSYYGVGYIGEGPYQSSYKKVPDPAYNCWRQMLSRCYNVKNKDYARYGGRGVYVNDCWHNYQNFAEWFHMHYREDLSQTLDKDILHRGNLEYGPSTSVLVPRRVNTLLINPKKGAGQYARGVFKSGNNYMAAYRYNQKQVHIGNFKTMHLAFLAYKEHREFYIKKVADEEYLRGTISKETRDALHAWEIYPY